MGSVPHLYTTGDNDPETEPRQHYRHYLYCDACGSFELDPWHETEDHRAVEGRRQLLAKAAVLCLPLIVVPVLTLLGLEAVPTMLVLLVAGVACSPILWRFVSGSARASTWRERWKQLWMVLAWLPAVLLIDMVVPLVVPPWAVLIAGLLVFVGLLAWRGTLSTEVRGLRCRECGTAYPYGGPLFSDLEANPHHLTLDEVPRPLGSTPFQEGRHLGPAPIDPGSQPSHLPP